MGSENTLWKAIVRHRPGSLMAVLRLMGRGNG
jgi:hypothetical protein